jgi:hypothetical protein
VVVVVVGLLPMLLVVGQAVVVVTLLRVDQLPLPVKEIAVVMETLLEQMLGLLPVVVEVLAQLDLMELLELLVELVQLPVLLVLLSQELVVVVER